MNQLGDQEAQILAYSQAVKKLEAQLVTIQKQQLSLNEKLTFLANEIYEKDEKLKKYKRIGMKVVKEKEQLQKILDSWKDSSKNLWRLINSGMSSSSKIGLGYEIKSNDEVLSYEEEMNFSVFNLEIILLNHKKKLNDSVLLGKKAVPQEPEPSVSDDRSSECSTCQSNDSAGSIGTSSVHSVDSESEISSVPPEVYVSTPITTNEKGVSDPKSKEVEPSCVSHIKTPRQPIKDQATPKVNRKNWNAMMERELGEGYSFTKKKCFVCGSLSHLIKDCDYYEKKMAREAEFKKQRVFNTGNRVAKLVWTNANRVNHANQFVPRSVQLNAGRPNINSVRPNINTDSEEEEPEDQGRKIQDDPLVSLIQRLVTPSKTTVNASGEEQVEDIKRNTLESAKILSHGGLLHKSQRSIDNGEESQRLAEEEELNEQQKQRRAQVQFEAQHYTDEDWDLYKQRIEARLQEFVRVCLGIAYKRRLCKEIVN
ncbi:hypothetical protein Tco_0386376 [Tanacetum coccineum]